MDLTDGTALVTGANRGIGRALCEALAARPLKLVLAGVRDPDAFEPIAGRASADCRTADVKRSCADARLGLPLLVRNGREPAPVKRPPIKGAAVLRARCASVTARCSPKRQPTSNVIA